MGLMPTFHDPTAFESFRALDAGFDISKFDLIAVTPANDSEKRQSPSGTYYSFDGVHRALVLAHRVMSGQSKYQPVEALLLTPRRDEGGLQTFSYAGQSTKMRGILKACTQSEPQRKL